jgi:hypothetical protein
MTADKKEELPKFTIHGLKYKARSAKSALRQRLAAKNRKPLKGVVTVTRITNDSDDKARDKCSVFRVKQLKRGKLRGKFMVVTKNTINRRATARKKAEAAVKSAAAAAIKSAAKAVATKPRATSSKKNRPNRDVRL